MTPPNWPLGRLGPDRRRRAVGEHQRHALVGRSEHGAGRRGQDASAGQRRGRERRSRAIDDRQHRAAVGRERERRIAARGRESIEAERREVRLGEVERVEVRRQEAAGVVGDDRRRERTRSGAGDQLQVEGRQAQPGDRGRAAGTELDLRTRERGVADRADRRRAAEALAGGALGDDQRGALRDGDERAAIGAHVEPGRVEQMRVGDMDRCAERAARGRDAHLDRDLERRPVVLDLGRHEEGLAGGGDAGHDVAEPLRRRADQLRCAERAPR